MARKRPVYLNLIRLRWPVAAIVSGGHRISGVLLFLLIPFLIRTLELSLSGEAGFATVAAWFDRLDVRLLMLAVLWATVHHLCAGIRFLLIDLDWFVEQRQARITAWLVHACAATSVAVAAAVMLP